MRFIGHIGLPLLASVVLMACGGGDDAGPATAAPSSGGTAAATPNPVLPPASAPASAAAPASVAAPASDAPLTVPSYVAARVVPQRVDADRLPDASEAAAIFDDSRAVAVSQIGRMQARNFDSSNLLVVPPLGISYLNVLSSAARGDTLAEVSARYTPNANRYVAASETRSVSRQLWARQDERFAPAFLEATDTVGSFASLTDWQAAETDYSYGISSAFTLAQSAAGVSVATTSNTHLVVIDTIAAKLDWPEVVPFTGVYLADSGKRLKMPMLRLSGRAVRHTGTDFTADAMTLGDYTLMTIRPTGGWLPLFAAGRLDAALTESVSALTGGAASAALPAGELILPVVPLNLDTQVSGVVDGIHLAFDEINANMRGLDGVGGTYASAASPRSLLHIGASGLTVQAANALAFDFSPKNIYGPTYSSGDFMTDSPISFTVGSPSEPACGRANDLRSFYLVLLDGRKMVLALAAISSLDGTVCR